MAFALGTDIRPVGIGDHKAFIRKGTLGATTLAGAVVALQSDGKWDPADGSTAALVALGVAVQGGGDGDAIDIVTYGPVKCVSGATPGTKIYVDDGGDAGEMTETAAALKATIGYAETDEIVFVQPIPAAWA